MPARDWADFLQAHYAMCCEEQEVKIAFESELDVETLGKLLMARVAERGGKDWASRSVCNLDSRLKIVRRSNRRPSMAETTAAAFAALARGSSRKLRG